MAFSTDVKKELSGQKIKKGCCRWAYLFGLLSDASIDGDIIIYKTTLPESRDAVMSAIKSTVRAETEQTESINLGKPVYYVTFTSENVANTLKNLAEGDAPVHCPNCEKYFLDGAFVSYGTVSEPLGSYHLEFRLKNISVARTIYKLLSDAGVPSKIVNRKSGVGLYYKNGGAIEEVLTHLGATKTLFDFINARVEKELRNSINRSTNCLAGNISKSVSAASRQVSAITALGEEGYLMSLPDDLFETARLRLEYPTATLSELALAHEPPISKSGLNHRLAKIMEFAEEKKVIYEK